MAGEPEDHALGYSRGGLGTKVDLVVDGHGTPLAATATAGQAHESMSVGATLMAVRLPGPGRPGDKGYSHARIRRYLRRRGIVPVIPTGKDQRSNPRFDEQAYKRRNVIERCTGWLEESRRVGTRHEKLAVNYLAMVKLAIICRRLRILESPDRT